MKGPKDSGIAEKIARIKLAMNQTALACGRNPDTVRLVAVTKTRSAEAVKSALEAGVQILGENYIQEARCKIRDLAQFTSAWHFIGHLQSNKARDAVMLFDLIHTVDSMKTAVELNRQAEKTNQCQKILIQVNVAQEPSKSGIAPKKARELVEQISLLDHLSIRGLMTMPPYSNDPETSRPFFKALHSLGETLEQARIFGVYMEELSMGTTGDFTVAIEEGATLVRIGTAIFGKRT